MTFQSNQCDHVCAPFASSVTATTVAAILSIITVPGNLLICWAVIWNPTRNLRSPFNYLVLNLAVADLFAGIVTEPLSVVYHLKEALEHNVDVTTGWVLRWSFVTTTAASVLSIVDLAVNRYQTVTTNRIQRVRLSRVVATSVLLWVCSLGLPFVLYLGVDFHKLIFIFANTAVAVCIVVLVFVYFHIYRDLRQHEENTKHIRSNREQAKRVKQEKKITISFLLTVISFLACAVPSFVMIYIITLCNTCSCVLIHWLRDQACQFLLVNSATNQFLYAWRVRSFRKAFQTIHVIQWVARTFQRGRIHQTPPGQPNQRMDQSSRSQNSGIECMAQCYEETKAGEVLTLADIESGEHTV